MATAVPKAFPAQNDRPDASGRESAWGEVRLAVVEPPGRWLMEEDDVPETPLHDAVLELLMLVLRHWAQHSGRSVLVARNLGCRWDPSDARVGTDPDVAIIEPAPPNPESLTTLRVWEAGHVPPRVAVEVVSETTASKDYVEAPFRYSRLGVNELWVFDPLQIGPEETGGPFRLQVWRRTREGDRALERVYAGPGPARSDELPAWLLPAAGGSRLRLANDPEGTELWPTEAEAEHAAASQERARVLQESERARQECARAEQERARAQQESERAAAAEAEVARLRRLLAERGE